MRVLQLLLLSSMLLLLSGCSAVLEQIQQVTGNEVKNISEKNADLRDDANEEKQLYEQGLQQSPTPSTNLNDILNDEGEGRYTGDPFQAKKVNEALNIMPEGLTEDKVYAYLLGLVGEKYKEDVANLSNMEGPNYPAKMRVITHGEQTTQPPPPKKPPIIPVKPKPNIKPTPPKPKPSNVAILIDVSSTMATVYEGKTRYDWAKLYTLNFLRQLPKDANVTIRLFGHQGGPSKKEKTASCEQTEQIYHAKPVITPPLMTKFSQVEPTGWSPLVNALQASLTEMSKQQLPQAKNIVYVIADSSDTCGADLDQEISDIQASKLGVMINVIGIDVPAKDETELTQLAEASGGDYQPIMNAAHLNDIAQDQAGEVKQIHEPWELRVIKKMISGYQISNERLKSNYEQIVRHLNEEHQRLTDANNLVKNQHKIDATEWKKINGWINNRYEGVLGYTEQKWHSKQAEFDQSFDLSLQNIEQKWQQNNQKLKPYEKQKNMLLQQVHQQKTNISLDKPGE